MQCFRIFGLVIIGATFYFIPSHALAQTSAGDCAEITSPDSRLACYDMIFRAESSVSKVSDNWTVEVKTNPIDDSTTVMIYTSSTQGQSRWGVPLALILRCKSDKTEVYINWRDFLGSDSVRVTTRIGSEEAETKTWGLSTDNEATFYPDNDIRFIKQLFGNNRLVAQTTPYNESPVTAIFDISGLEDAIVELREVCGW